MTNGSSPEQERLKLDRDRLALDQDRLAFDKRRFEQEDFLARWQVDNKPLHEHRLLSREQSHSFAKVVIQMLFLLNGGALIAIPGFAQLVRGQIDLAKMDIIPFIVGLVCITVTATSAYLSMDLDAGAVSDNETGTRLRLIRERTPAGQLSDNTIQQAAAERSRRKKYGWVIALSIASIAFGAASLSAFVYGAVHAANTLKETPIHAPPTAPYSGEGRTRLPVQ